MFDGVNPGSGGYPAGLPSWLQNLGAFVGAGAVGGIVKGPSSILTQSPDTITLGGGRP
jgi:hypothetical protein